MNDTRVTFGNNPYIVIHSIVVTDDGWVSDFHITIRGLGLNADVCANNSRYGESFYEFISQLASHESPWSDEKSWESLDGVLGIRATCNKLGHTALTFEVTSTCSAGAWKALAKIECGIGELTGLSQQLKTLFACNA